MAEHGQQSDINFIKPLHVVASFFALVPLCDVKEGSRIISYKIYSAIVALCVIIVYSLTIYSASTTVVFDIFTQKVLYLFNCTISTALIVSANYSAFSNFADFSTYMMLFYEVNKRLHTTKISQTGILVQLVLIHFIFVGCTGYVLHIIINLETSLMIRYIYHCVEEYFALLITLVILNCCIYMKIKCKTLQGCLENAVNTYLTRSKLNNITIRVARFVEEDSKIDSEKSVALTEVENIKDAFTKLCGAMGFYNNIFGYQLLFLFGSLTGKLLNVINDEMIEYSNPDRSLRNIAVIWFVVDMIMGIVVAVICDMTTKEGQQTATVCYNLLLNVPTTSKNVQDRILREELILLAQQATHQCPYFSAAGFFTVDYTMLFGLVGTVCTPTFLMVLAFLLYVHLVKNVEYNKYYRHFLE